MFDIFILKNYQIERKSNPFCSLLTKICPLSSSKKISLTFIIKKIYIFTVVIEIFCP